MLLTRVLSKSINRADQPLDPAAVVRGGRGGGALDRADGAGAEAPGAGREEVQAGRAQGQLVPALGPRGTRSGSPLISHSRNRGGPLIVD